MNASHQEHEFEASHASTIRSLAGAMKFVAVVEIILGVLYGLMAVFGLVTGSLLPLVVYAVSCILTIVMAVMLANAANHFRAVVDTAGSDITFLMAALAELRGFFAMKRVLYIIGIALVVVAIGFGILFGLGRSHVSFQSSSAPSMSAR